MKVYKTSKEGRTRATMHVIMLVLDGILAVGFFILGVYGPAEMQHWEIVPLLGLVFIIWSFSRLVKEVIVTDDGNLEIRTYVNQKTKISPGDLILIQKVVQKYIGAQTAPLVFYLRTNAAIFTLNLQASESEDFISTLKSLNPHLEMKGF